MRLDEVQIAGVAPFFLREGGVSRQLLGLWGTLYKLPLIPLTSFDSTVWLVIEIPASNRWRKECTGFEASTRAQEAILILLSQRHCGYGITKINITPGFCSASLHLFGY